MRFRESGCVKKVVDSEEKMPNVVFEAVSGNDVNNNYILMYEQLLMLVVFSSKNSH